MIFKYTKYPKAAKEYLAVHDGGGAIRPVDAGVDRLHVASAEGVQENPIWTVDPKHTPYRDVLENMRPAGYAGKLGYASAGVLADFIIVDMVAEAASGQNTPKEAAARAQKRAERYYKV